ncbi:hypothetical protein GE21DRAFT_1232458, partial [Neurospora crassa]
MCRSHGADRQCLISLGLSCPVLSCGVDLHHHLHTFLTRESLPHVYVERICKTPPPYCMDPHSPSRHPLDVSASPNLRG